MKTKHNFEVDLIDFKRKNIWMAGIEKTTNPTSLFKIAIITLIVTIVATFIKTCL